MREKTKIGYVPGAVDSAIIHSIEHRLQETSPGQFEIIELTPEHYSYGRCSLDIFCSKTAIDRHISVINRQSFRKTYKDRIDRYNRVWPRHGSPMLTWNRDQKWLPRFYADTAKIWHFSQSQLRLSQVLSWRPGTVLTPHTVCSLEDLDLSRWPTAASG